MLKEELIQKYLDNELSQEERLEVEKILSDHDTDRQLFEKVKATRNEFINALDLLNPDEAVEIPLFKTRNTKIFKLKTKRIRYWHYAAIAAMAIGIYFGIKEFTDKRVTPDDTEVSQTQYKELDFYISPNRCWNQKQLEWRTIELNH